ncbi:MAG: NADH-quinone oxidoreductase subunit M [Candidatus Methylomirabilis sp.]|nr:NADH-quinone oxidoreductase subunit M [Deltaproteobacteria bacterium]
MILAWAVLIPLLGGAAAWISSRLGEAFPRWISLFALALDFVLLLFVSGGGDSGGRWLAEIHLEWIPGIGAGIHLAADGLSLALALLTAFLGMAAVAASWTGIRERTGFFHLCLMSVIAGVMGAFLALDLLLFYIFWELMLVPMFFMIAVWGHGGRQRAALKFFIFTQAGSLLMLVSILGLYFVHGMETGSYSFNYNEVLGTTMGRETEFWLMLGFLAAFAVKLPAVPFHTWLPEAHAEAPTGGSVILAGLLLKTGAYGIIRFLFPLFPNAAATVAPVVYFLAVIGIIYGAVLAIGQTDLKRLIAYTSVSHMGFVLLGIFAREGVALNGALVLMVCHGASTGALFIIAGAIEERAHTREMGRMGGFWSSAPKMGGAALFFALASLGLPGLGNFLGEFLVLLGAFRVSALSVFFAALGLIASVVYSLWIIQKVFHGPAPPEAGIPDIGGREAATLAAMAAVVLWLGLYPAPFFDRMGIKGQTGGMVSGIESGAVSGSNANGPEAGRLSELSLEKVPEDAPDKTTEHTR